MRKASNNILENLRDSLKLSDLDSYIQELMVDGNIVKLYKCNNCGNIIDEYHTKSIKTDMESYYGVGSDFPDHHYENLSGCPKCDSTDLEDLGNYSLEDFEDYELFEASKWKHYSGERLGKPMDDGYEQKIQNKLLPLLNHYDIEMHTKPFIDKPGRQVYYGESSNGDEIVITFYNNHEDKSNNREGKNDMLVKIMFNGKEEEAGVIELDSTDGLDNAFALITMTLENLGFKLKDQEEIKTKEDNKENGIYNDLLNFKHSLRESELMEILVD